MWDDSMLKELSSLGDIGSVKLFSRPRGAKTLQSTWVFKRKRYPDGSLRTYKARLYVRGNQHVDSMDVFDTYAPVLS